MIKFWSEVPSARAREMVADVATWFWMALWTVVARAVRALARPAAGSPPRGPSPHRGVFPPAVRW